MIYRRRFKQLFYPASPEEWLAAGYVNPSNWDEDFGIGGFWVMVLANPTGADERHELKLRAEFMAQPTEQTRGAYRKELAWRVPEWNYQTEGENGVVDVPAPGEGDENYDAFELLPTNIASWLTQEIRTIHLPKAPAPPSGQPGTPDSPSDAGPTQEP